MPEPTSTAAGIATVAAYAGATSAITAFGVPLGLRADLLIAGFAGSLVAIILLNTVPGTGDTWQQLARTTWRHRGRGAQPAAVPNRNRLIQSQRRGVHARSL